MSNFFISYIEKRFPITKNLPIILLFYLSIFLYSGVLDKKIVLSIRLLLGFIVFFLIFLRIRIFDDIKDYRFDKKRHPDRPLSRNIVSVKQMKNICFFVILIEASISAILGLHTFLIYTLALVFTILIYFEFFMKKLLTKNKIVYNSTHQIIIIVLALYVYTVYNQTLQEINILHVLLFLNMFLIFSLFEFTRKIKNREDDYYKDSYQYHFGKKKFSLLMIVMLLLIGSITGFLIISVLPSIVHLVPHFILTTFFIIISFLYADDKKIKGSTLKKGYFIYLISILFEIILAILIYKTLIIETISG